MLRIALTTKQAQAYAAKQVLASPVDGTMEVVIKKTQRTNKQNALFWQYVTLLGDHLGYTKMQMHDAICEEFLEPVVFEFRGKTIEKLGETSQLDRKEMGELITKLQAWGATEFAYILPRPDDGLMKAYA